VVHISRRHFLAGSSALAAVAALREVPLFGQAAAPPSPPVTSFADVRGAVRIFNGRGGTIGVRATKGLLAIVDTQFADTAAILVEATKKDRDGAFRVLLTHHHGDHTGGNKVVKDAGATLSAHANVPDLQKQAAAQAPAGSAPPVLPDETYARTHSVGSGDAQITMVHDGPAHTGGDSVVHFVHENVVHMGDLVFNRRHPFIDRPGGASIQNWIVLLEKVAKRHTPDTKYIFGHAGEGFPVVGDRSDLMAMRDYLTALIEAAQSALKAGTPREAFTQSKLPAAFAVYDPKTPPANPNPRFGLPANLGIAYDEVSEKK
jgi:glyoxylase-like metal-dependent hydrolase (beta-lactamase superfamily II)